MRSRHTVQTRANRQTQGRSVRTTSVLMLVAAGAVIVVLIVLFPLDWVRVPAITITAERRAFSPNGDGSLDDIAIIYSLSQNATVTVQVLNAGQQVVRTLAQEEVQAAGQHSALWDGRSDQGAVVPDGEYLIRVEAQGSVRSASQQFALTLDNTAPVIRLANLPEGHKVGTEELLIEGTTEPGSTLWLNDRPQPLTVEPSGGFGVRHRLQEGVNRLELRAIDPSGNVSSVTREVTLVLHPPEIIVDNPPDGTWINQRLLSVQGRTTPDSTLAVNGNRAPVQDDGRFNVDVLLDEGENVVRLEATDPVGNETNVERQVFVKLQPPPISLLSIQEEMEVHEPSILVAGQTEAGATVRVNGQETVVDTQGGFQTVVNLVEGLNLIRVEAIDQAGNAARATSNIYYSATTAQPPGTTLRTTLLAGGIGAALMLAIWILLGGWYGPNALSLTTDQPFLSSDPYEGQDLRFALELARPAQVRVQVWNGADELVADLMHRRRQHAGLHVMEWDGTDDRGRPVPDGAYEIEATASTIFTTVTNRMSVFKTSERLPTLVTRRPVERRAPSRRADEGLEQNLGWE